MYTSHNIPSPSHNVWTLLMYHVIAYVKTKIAGYIRLLSIVPRNTIQQKIASVKRLGWDYVFIYYIHDSV